VRKTENHKYERINSMSSMTIHDAAKAGDLEKVKAFIAAGGDVNAPSGDDGITAIMLAAANGKADCVRALIAAGADVNAHTKLVGLPANLGLTALMLARRSPGRNEDTNADYEDIMVALKAAGATK
jgi:ankyrin repeat protein